METVGTAGSTHAPHKRPGILYPVMLVAAIAVIVFSVVGIATMMGWMPSARSGGGATDKATEVPGASPGAIQPALTPAPSCDVCGVVESIRPVQVKGEGSGAGAVGGAVVGAGAYPGHEIEKNMQNSVSYQISVRMNDGTTRTFYEPAQPALAAGQKVRISERGIVAAR
jgi:hypothetical protein